jgi:Protein of unknown function (DUF2508).
MERENILKTIDEIKQNLYITENKFNNTTEPILIDSYIYELKALQMQYKFYMKLCKEQGIKFI